MFLSSMTDVNKQGYLGQISKLKRSNAILE